MMSIRLTTLRLLLSWERDAEYINLSLGKVTPTLSDTDRRFLTALLYGVVEHALTLDYYIASLTQGKSLDATVCNLLRMGIYELSFMHTPPHAVVNEIVKLARHKGEASLLNAILRRVANDPSCLVLPPREKNVARYLSIAYSVPLPTVKKLISVLGEETEVFLSVINEKAPLTLRINTEKMTRDAYLSHLSEADIVAVPTPYSPFGVTVLTEIPPTRLFGFEEGLFYVQDEASQISTLILSPQAGDTVIDICACPGGKSFGAALMMQNQGSILSCDLHASKLPLIQEGAKRLGISVIETLAHDGTESLHDREDTADCIICDVPCSGLGVFGKKADLRYKSTETLDTLPPLQSAILEVASRYVKPEGTLLYSTCTIHPGENEDVVTAFLQNHKDFVAVPFSLPSRDVSMPDLSAPDGMLTLYPHIHHTDGFFIAKLVRKSATPTSDTEKKGVGHD